MADLADQIESAAATPKSVQNGDQKVESRPISELIEADKYLAAKTAVQTRPGVIFSKLQPPGGA